MRLTRRAFWLLPLLALPLPLVLNQYYQYVVNLILVYVLVGVGFNIVVGNLGQLAFSNVAFFGIGAYASAILTTKLGMPWWLTVIPAGLIGALAGCAASIPALRGVRLFYLAIMTLAFGELMRWSYIRTPVLTGGSMGLSVPPAEVLGWTLTRDDQKFYVFLFIVVVVVVCTNRILESRIGRAFQAIKNDEKAAAAMAIATSRYFLLAFALSGFVVGIGGAMYAALVGHLSPEAFDLVQLIQQFAIIMVGGLGSLAGSVLGAILITATPEIFRDWPGFEELMFGVVIVLVIMFLPRGLVSLLARIHPVFKDRFYQDD
ncbi:MAG: branched-chain amino acid ABC transporter permease [Ectothiorhodospiraceae bacterium]|nr:branched-chain amino acid ABC transporter permease [Chromatiales bacterium]MCP5155698.1 branched-chain amino acid ABC transporter permease [Ectothiorhodospiraceae bacterium]